MYEAGCYLSRYEAVRAGPARLGVMPIKDVKKRLSATFESFSSVRRGSREEAPVEDKCKTGSMHACMYAFPTRAVIEFAVSKSHALSKGCVSRCELEAKCRKAIDTILAHDMRRRCVNHSCIKTQRTSSTTQLC